MAIKLTHRQTVSRLAVVITTLFLLIPAVSNAGQAGVVDKTVRHLLAYVASSNLTFIRNSGRYTAQEAAAHMQKKYEHFRDEINTPEDFIRLSATRSILSGKPYLVINAQGETVKTGKWLSDELEAYRKSSAGGAD